MHRVLSMNLMEYKLDREMIDTLNNTLNGYSSIANNNLIVEDILGDEHAATSFETPIRADAFELSEEEKIEKIIPHFQDIMEILGLDLEDDSLAGTPRRVAKMFVKEIFGGLNPENKPAATLFDNKFQYKNMLVERNIPLYSTCEHHFLPIYGKAHVAYMSSGKVIGLSKINRIVEYFAKRPQVQERLTMQIGEELQKILDTENVAVYIDAKHMCVQSRGIKHEGGSTATTFYGGKFMNENTRKEFLHAIAQGNL